MERLFIAQTRATPGIDFSIETGVLHINGQSYPENAFKFYEPILFWIDEFFANDQHHQRVTLEISMPYLNTSSSKCMMMILEKFEEAVRDGRDIIVNWSYDEENEGELECAEELKEFVDLEFNILPLPK